MSKRRGSSKVIHCILPKGHAQPVVEALKDELGIITANFHFARGTGRITHGDYHSTVTETEKEVLEVVVTEEEAESAFELIYYTAGIDKPHGGLMYQSVLSESTEYLLPELLEEK